MKIINLLLKSVQRFPRKIAIHEPQSNRSLTYEDLYRNILGYALLFYEKGITAGTKIALCSKNSLEWIFCFYALLQVGAAPVLLSHHFTRREILECLQGTNTTQLIIDTERFSRENWQSFINEGYHLYHIAAFQEEIESIKATFDDLTTANGIEKKWTQHMLHSEIILFTYRGYGHPLAVLFSEQSIINSVFNNRDCTKVDESLILTLLLPLSHIFSLTSNLLVPLSIGGTLVIIPPATPREIIAIINNYKVNFIAAVPSLVYLLLYSLNKGCEKLKFVKKGIVGANSFEKELFTNWLEATDSLMLQGYGLTETCPVICNTWDDYRPEALGKPMAHVLAKILDCNGKEVPPLKEARLFIHCNSLLKGYLNEPVPSHSYQEWFDTGDIVYKDNYGFYYFVRRDKAIAKIGGETVDLEEIKKVSLSYSKVTDAAILVEKDKLWQEKLICRIKVLSAFDKGLFWDYLKDNLASYKIPKVLEIE